MTPSPLPPFNSQYASSNDADGSDNGERSATDNTVVDCAWTWNEPLMKALIEGVLSDFFEWFFIEKLNIEYKFYVFDFCKVQ